MKNPHLVIIFLLVFGLSLPGLRAQAELRCEKAHQPTVQRTEIKNAALATNSFNTHRRLEDYAKQLNFRRTGTLFEMIDDLGAGSIVMDMGAGEARALVDILEENRHISKGVALSFKKPETSRTEQDAPGRFQYLEGDFVENMMKDGKLDHLKNRVDLITDVYGPISYSEHLPELFQTYFDLLGPQKILVFTLMTERNFKQTAGQRTLLDNPSPINQFIQNGRAAHEGIIAWLRTIPGVEVIEVVEGKASDQDAWERYIGIKIMKISDRVIVPRNLNTHGYSASSPPERHFEILPDSSSTFLPR